MRARALVTLFALQAAGCQLLLDIDPDRAPTAARDASADPAQDASGAAAPRVDADANAEDEDECGIHVPFGPLTRMDDLSSTSQDVSLRFSANGLTAYFTSDRRHPSAKPRFADADTFVTHRPSLGAPFGLAEVVPTLAEAAPIGELHPTEAADGLHLYFDRSETDVEFPARAIWVASRTRTTEAYGPPTKLALDAFYSAQEPFVVPDGSALYFSGVEGISSTVYRATLAGNTIVSTEKVRILDPAGHESTAIRGAPVVTPDERVVYFTQLNEVARFDVWVARRARRDLPFTDAKRVDELNVKGSFDTVSSVSADSCTVYISSDRSGDKDLYWATKKATQKD